jgi:transcriptional regulator with XRE-family HTH domain
MTKVGTFIKTTRTEMGLTQKSLATKLGWKSPQFISNIERGEAILPVCQLKKMSRVLSTKTSSLVNMHISDYRTAVEKTVK